MTEDKHSAPASARQELLYDPEVPTPTHAEHARTLAARIRTGTLSTVAREPQGTPYGSFVTFALTADGSPIFLVSNLAEHTRNLREDARCSLLIAEQGEGNPLALGRITLLGSCAEVGEETRAEAREAFLEAHPDASYYVDFTDFAFWRLDTQGVRYIGGFGRMSWVPVEAWRSAEPDPLAPHVAGIVAHMNEDHAETMVAYCRAFSKAVDTSAASLTQVDRYGFEMSAQTEVGPRPIRLPFSRTVTTPDEVRQEMVTLAGAARAKLG